QVEAGVAVLAQRPELYGEVVEVGVAVEIDGEVGEALLECRRLEVAGAFVEQPRDHEGGTLAAFFIGRRAAAKAYHGGDQRVAVVLDQPGGDAPGAHHFLDVD